MLESVNVILKTGGNIIGRVRLSDLKVLSGSLWVNSSSGFVIIPIENIDHIVHLRSADTPVVHDTDFDSTLDNLDRFNENVEATSEQDEMPLAVMRDSRGNTSQQLQDLVDAGPPSIESDDGTSIYAKPPVGVVVGNVPDSVAKAEQLLAETRTGVTSDELEEFIEDDDEDVARVVVHLFDSGIDIYSIAEQVEVPEEVVIRLLQNADRNVDDSLVVE